MPLPADYLVVDDGLYLSAEALEKIRKSGPRSKYHDASLIGAAMKKRLAHWRDLKRPGFKEAECHICLPPHRFDSNGQKIGVAAERLFLVYTRRREYGDVVFDWEWKPGSTATGVLFDDNFFGERIDHANDT